MLLKYWRNITRFFHTDQDLLSKLNIYHYKRSLRTEINHLSVRNRIILVQNGSGIN